MMISRTLFVALAAVCTALQGAVAFPDAIGNDPAMLTKRALLVMYITGTESARPVTRFACVDVPATIPNGHSLRFVCVVAMAIHNVDPMMADSVLVSPRLPREFQLLLVLRWARASTLMISNVGGSGSVEQFGMSYPQTAVDDHSIYVYLTRNDYIKSGSLLSATRHSTAN
ncbi:hypothetical protein JOM56_004348 [Amanita muscaria]